MYIVNSTHVKKHFFYLRTIYNIITAIIDWTPMFQEKTIAYWTDFELEN